MPKQITYSKLAKLLHKLGFEMRSVKGSHRVFRNPKRGSVIVLYYRSAREPVRHIHIAAVKRILSETGILSKEKFEELIRK